jgi:sulfate/thiosulfate transport system permease protein
MTGSFLGASAGPRAMRSGPDDADGVAPEGFPGAWHVLGSGGTALRFGVATVWLSVIVLLPLAAIAWQAADGGWRAFWPAVTSNAALQSFRVTLTIAAGVTVANLVFGLLIAWVLVRDEFVGKRLVDTIIDLPFALPTIVASLVMLALYGNNSPVGLHLQHTAAGVAVALAFVTLPFVVRAVQPVLLEIDRETEEAAASLGATAPKVFTSIVLPSLTPALSLRGVQAAFRLVEPLPASTARVGADGGLGRARFATD